MTPPQAQGEMVEQVKLAVKSNLALDGKFGAQWLLMAPRDLWVIERHKGTANLRHRSSLDFYQKLIIQFLYL